MIHNKPIRMFILFDVNKMLTHDLFPVPNLLVKLYSVGWHSCYFLSSFSVPIVILCPALHKKSGASVRIGTLNRFGQPAQKSTSSSF